VIKEIKVMQIFVLFLEHSKPCKSNDPLVSMQKEVGSWMLVVGSWSHP